MNLDERGARPAIDVDGLDHVLLREVARRRMDLVEGVGIRVGSPVRDCQSLPGCVPLLSGERHALLAGT